MRRRDARWLVVAFFEHPTAADTAARLLQRRTHAVGRGGTVGVLTCDSSGRLATRLGPHGDPDSRDVGNVLGRIVRALTGREPPAGRDWYVNGQGQTLAIVRGPVEFAMGSPASEAGREPNEVRHRRRMRYQRNTVP